MELLFDVDGPIANFSSHLLKQVGSTKKLTDVVDWNIRKLLNEEQSKKMTAILNDSEATFWATQPVVRGAKMGMKKILAAGHTVHWVTSPWPSCRTWEATRREWLYKHFKAGFKDSSMVFGKWRITGDVLLDDKTEHVVEWRKLRAWDPDAALLYDAPYNQDAPDGLKRVSWLPARPGVEYIPDVIEALAKKQISQMEV
jgi:hypothetical protein